MEPAKAMLDVCRQQAEAKEAASRCIFHQGYLDSLPETESFDAATSILVSHFIKDQTKRRKYYSEIAQRLGSNAYMINAELANDLSASDYTSSVDVWVKMLGYAGMSASVESFGKDVAILPTQQVEALLISSGFDSPVPFFQVLFMHAWFSRVGS